MKIFEIVSTPNSELVVDSDDAVKTVLRDPRTNIKVNVPKQAGKQGMITQDEKGNFIFDPEDESESQEKLTPGSKVMMAKKQ